MYSKKIYVEIFFFHKRTNNFIFFNFLNQLSKHSISANEIPNKKKIQFFFLNVRIIFLVVVVPELILILRGITIDKKIHQ